MAYDFNNKVVWITGASKGIGLATALELLNAGAKLAVSARNQTQLEEGFAGYENCLCLALDVTSKEANRETVEKITKHYGQLDCIFLNAGNAEYVDISNFDSAMFERMINVNYLAMLYAIEAALPELRKSRAPYRVGMTSSVAWVGLPRGYAYSASKAAARNMLQGLRVELARENIPVTVICPGFVKTPLTDKNDFPMPGLITAEDAGKRIYKGLCKQKPELSFPKRFTLFLRLLSILPEALSVWLIKRTV